jgi:hypothetical protein
MAVEDKDNAIAENNLRYVQYIHFIIRSIGSNVLLQARHALEMFSVILMQHISWVPRLLSILLFTVIINSFCFHFEVKSRAEELKS